MIPVLSVDNMRKSDAAAVREVSAGTLMTRAGKAVFNAVEWREPVAIVCGPGNNGGDGFVIALEMLDRHMECALYLTSDRVSDTAEVFYDECVKRGLAGILVDESTSFEGYGTVADCIFGTGFHGEPSGVYALAIDRINRSGAYVVSVDINSGLNGDSGLASKCVISDMTVSIGSFQPGHFLNMAGDVMRSRKNCDIGIAPADRPFGLLEAEDLAPLFPERKHFSHKGTYGYTALIGGSLRYSGAIRLAAMANAAVRSGAGVVFAAVPSSIAGIVAGNVLESTVYSLSDNEGFAAFNERELSFLAERCRTIACGMGIGTEGDTGRIVGWLLGNFRGTLVIDADGLNAIAGREGAIRDAVCGSVILTPHIGEFSRLTGLSPAEIQDDPIGTARDFASREGCVVLLKGPTTVITDGDRVLMTDRGCPGMATGGSGDVLSGIIAAVAGYSDDKLLAAAGAAYINGLAGELAEADTNPVSMTAGDTAGHVAGAIGQVLKRIGKNAIITDI